MAAIFDGVDDLIDSSLGVVGIGTKPHYKHRTSALRLNVRPSCFLASELVEEIYQKLEDNWHGAQCFRKASRENWRWSKRTYISENNGSREKILEKAIVAECDDGWVNQVPTASGVIDSTSEKHCNIDLAHRISDDVYELIELKVDSDTPHFAAFELLKYALMYVFSRQHAIELGYDTAENPLLAAKQVDLCVLAPDFYYLRYEVGWLEKALNRALAPGDSIPSSLRFHFRFDQYDGLARSVSEVLSSRRPLFATEQAAKACDVV